MYNLTTTIKGRSINQHNLLFLAYYTKPIENIELLISFLGAPTIVA